MNPQSVEQLAFRAGSFAAARREVQTTVEGSLSASATPSEVTRHVLVALLDQIPALSVPDVLELRVVLDIDDIEDAPLGEQIEAVFESAVHLIVQWFT